MVGFSLSPHHVCNNEHIGPAVQIKIPVCDNHSLGQWLILR